MPRLTIKGENNIPRKPSLFVPNRLSLESLKKLIHLLDGHLVILSDPDFALSDELQSWIAKSKLDRIHHDFRKGQPAKLRSSLLQCFNEEKHVLFLPGKLSHVSGRLFDIPAFILKLLGGLHFSPVPIFNTHYQPTVVKMVRNAATDKSQEYLSILPQLSPGPRAGERMLSAWMNCGVDIMERQPVLQTSLTTMLVRSLKENPKVEVIDGLSEGKASYIKLLGVAMSVAKTLDKEKNKRVGILLPPGPGAIIATLACLLAGVTPVLINYASSHAAFESIKQQAALKCFISAGRFVEKLPDFPWPDRSELIYIEELLKEIGKVALLTSIMKAKVMPTALICRNFETDARSAQETAVLLFTSGSSGEPKGVALTHQMILANVSQCLSTIDLGREDRILASLPVFHSFGFTVTMMMPLLAGLRICTYPSPTDAKRLNELIVKYKLTLACSTPTFARAMLRRANADTYKSLNYFAVGAEKLQEDLRLEFLEKCNVQILEGYGMTEASPVCSINLPTLPASRVSEFTRPNQIPGSVGAVFPGLAIRITDLDDDSKEIPLTERGMLWLRGPNLFTGYLGKPEMHEEIFDGKWFKTGDIAQMNLHGFLTLSGRLSRFSKVGGEMVPHEGVEQLVIRALELDPNTPELQIAVTGVSDQQKGEALVLLSTLPQHIHQVKEKENLLVIRQFLIKEHIPNLWTPKYIVPVESIPVLPTGKLDLRACKQLAQEALEVE